MPYAIFFMFKLLKKSKISCARIGRLVTAHGVIQTPFFMPIATKGAIKGLTSDEMKKIKAQILLSNTYHLYLQPGLNVIKNFNGLHNFMNWQGPILTDSGGYQVFSLGYSEKRYKQNLLINNLVKIKKQGIWFKSFLDGSKHLFTPEKVQQIQDIIGSDIKMVLDVCSPYPCSKRQAEKDLELTHLWAVRSLEYHKKHKSTKTIQQFNNNLLFGIVQGSIYKDLRLKSAKFLRNLDFNGYAIGGLAVGESVNKLYQVLDYAIPELPENKPRYLMGVGRPEQIIEAVKRGIDMFDCVIPSREARHGRLYKFKFRNIFLTGFKNSKFEKNSNPEILPCHQDWFNSRKFYEIINIANSKYKNSPRVINPNCDCELCQNYSLGYLHHLFKSQEPLGIRLTTLHNLKFYLDLMKLIRLWIKDGKL